MQVNKLNWRTVLHLADGNNLSPDRTVKKSDKEWKEILTPEQYHITRQHGTERPFTGVYCENYEPGQYACVCCKEPLFDASVKFESKSGWPSFTTPVQDQAIKYIEDHSYGMHRVEVRCNVCDAHLGHVFPDGPEPTGLRFCINSASLEKIS